MNINKLGFAVVAGLIAIVWMTGTHQPVEAQATSPAPACEWRMFSENVAGTGGSSAGQDSLSFRGQPVYGTSWLYNGCTGEVQRIFDGCGDGYENGCVITLPVVTTSGSSAGFQPNMKLLTE